MKSQQGFVIFGGAAWLVAAALSGAFVATVESTKTDKATATTLSQDRPTLTLAAAAPSPQESSAIQQTTYVGTSYRNGGHYGDKNSDLKLESGDM